MKLSEDIIFSAFEMPLLLKSYPSHTQTVERMVPVVTESCSQKVGYSARHRWILSTLESRKLCPKFDTKSDDIQMYSHK